MADYNSLSTNELVDLLNQKDNEITSLENKLTTAQQAVYIGSELGETANTVIARILSLSETEKKSLPSLVRTTQNGVRAYTTFLYGVATGETTDESSEETIEQVKAIPYS